MKKLGVFVTVFNEASRIRSFLENVSKWADEILLFDKGSTDETLKIASEFPVSITHIPFSPPGYEVVHLKEMMPHLGPEWCVWATPSEVFTPRLIQYFRLLISQDDGLVDSVHAYTKIYAFGRTDPSTPYGNYTHLRMWHRDRALYTGLIHNGVKSRGNSRMIKDEAAYVLHQSHATFEGFVERQKGYSLCESDCAESKEAKAVEFIRMGEKFDGYFADNPGADLRLHLGWKVSMYLAALACLHKHREEETISDYNERMALEREAWNNVQ
jgi:hypothetical protein